MAETTYWHSVMPDGYLAPTDEININKFTEFNKRLDGTPYNNSVWRYSNQINNGYPYIVTTKEITNVTVGDFSEVKWDKYIFKVKDAVAREELVNRYTKTEADAKFADKMDTQTALNARYTKAEADTKFATITSENGIKVFLADNAAKNLLPITLDSLKALNTSGTWTNNSYEYQGVTYAVAVDSANRIKSITVSGTATANSTLNLVSSQECNFGNCIISTGAQSFPEGVVLSGATDNEFDHNAFMLGGDTMSTTLGLSNVELTCSITVYNGTNAGNTVVKPMIRRADITDDTYDIPYMTQKELDAAVRSLLNGGSGGGGYNETVLWENEGSTNPASVTLSSAYTNYDQIIFMVAAPAGEKYDKILPVSEMTAGMKIPIIVLDAVWVDYVLTDSTTLTYSNGRDLVLKKVIGIKYSGYDNYESEVFPNA